MVVHTVDWLACSSAILSLRWMPRATSHKLASNSIAQEHAIPETTDILQVMSTMRAMRRLLPIRCQTS